MDLPSACADRRLKLSHVPKALGSLRDEKGRRDAQVSKTFASWFVIHFE